MTDTREFPLADVLSITTPNLLSRRHIAGIIDLVNWLRRTDFTIAGQQFAAIAGGRYLVDESKECRALLIGQHPWLADIQPPTGIDTADLYSWLIHTEERHGDVVTVQRP